MEPRGAVWGQFPGPVPPLSHPSATGLPPGSHRGTPKVTKMRPKWLPNGTKMEPEWSRNGAKTEPRFLREDNSGASPLQETWQTHLQAPPPARNPTERTFSQGHCAVVAKPLGYIIYNLTVFILYYILCYII